MNTSAQSLSLAIRLIVLDVKLDNNLPIGTQKQTLPRIKKTGRRHRRKTFQKTL